MKKKDKKGILVKSTISVSELLTAYKFTPKKDSVDKGDVHNHPEIMFVLNNKLCVSVDNQKFVLNAGEMIMYAPNSFHMELERNGETILILSFRANGENLKELYNKVISLNKESQLYFIKLMDEILQNLIISREINPPRLIVKDGVSQKQTEIIKKKIEIFLLMIENQLSGTTIHNRKNSYNEILSVIKYLENNISNNFTVSEIANANAMSKSKLKYLFKDNFNTSPISYFHKLKLEKAKSMLLEGDKNITEIAESLGFQSVHYFSRFFKKNLGICPTKYVKAVDQEIYT